MRFPATALRPVLSHADLKITKSAEVLKKPFEIEGVKFGHKYAAHMLRIKFAHSAETDQWSVVGRPHIKPLGALKMHPGSKVLHYANTLFEGMKAYRGVDNKIRIFRPDKHMERFKLSSMRMALPAIDADEMIELISDLVKIDSMYVPSSEKSALYIRPVFMGTERTLGVSWSNKASLYVISCPVGAYYPTGFNPLSLYADPHYVRSWVGGVGAFKMGCNYTPTLYVQKLAANLGCQQALWLYDRNEKLTEVGVMNVFIYWTNEQGEEELITPPLKDGLILPGVTRDSLITLAKIWNEFKVTERYPTMAEIRKAIREKRMKQMFGSGTAAIVAPINRIRYLNPKTNELEDLGIPTMDAQPNVMKRFYDTINQIQYGQIEWPGWTRIIK